MKMSPMPAGAGGAPGTNLQSTNVGQTASAQKLAAAKAIAAGQTPIQVNPTEEHEREKPQSVRTITMRTNVSPDRFDPQIAAQAPETENSPISDQGGQTQAVTEATQPLSPQFAALAKQRRALQVKERELAEREAKANQTPAITGDMVSKADLLANPLKIFEMGLTYDQLTEAILSNPKNSNLDPRALKEELIQAAKDELNKTLSDRDTQAEAQVLSEMMKEAQKMIQEGDTYEMVRETGSLPQVKELIYRLYKKTGEVLDVDEALNLVETDLINESLKIANIKKVQSRLSPQPPVQNTQQLQQRQMRTLTNRDTASSPLDRRARAIAAMTGNLRK